MRKFRRSSLLYLLVAVIAVFVVLQLVGGGNDRKQFTLNQFQSELKKRHVTQATLYDKSHEIKGEFARRHDLCREVPRRLHRADHAAGR